MDVREKLVELLKNNREHYLATYIIKHRKSYEEYTADHLIAHGVTVQEWVSVNDRLPEESGMYIVTANDGHVQRVSFVLWQKRNRMWNLTGARSYWRVTHWQPMPELPKEA